VAIDLGTGSGRAVLRRAAREPSTLFIGVDPDAAALAEASRRAARPVRRGRLPNALFVLAAAEALPAELRGRADLVTIALPWGSLLRGLLRADERMLAAVALLLRPTGELELLLSATERDGTALALDRQAVASLVRAYASHGLASAEARPATIEDVERLSSGWGRRLGIPESRPAWLLRFRYAGVAGASGLEVGGGDVGGGVSVGGASAAEPSVGSSSL
jgi:16S rRNA (adenine(1408)-N(1))-methyltransferase